MSLADDIAGEPPRRAEPSVLLFDLERLPGEFTRDIWEPRDLARLNYLHPDNWTVKPRTLCASWKWYGERGTGFVAAWDNPGDPHHVASTLARLLDRAQVAVTFNGRKADLKWLRQDWAQGEIDPPTPYKDVDLYITARTAFALESRSLRYLCDFLGVPNKQGHYDAAEAKAAAAGDEKARRRLERYSRADSRIMEPVLDKLRPYVRGINLGLYHLDDAQRCPACGSDDLTPAGWTYTTVTAYAAYRCQSCRTVSRSKHRKHDVPMRGVV